MTNLRTNTNYGFRVTAKYLNNKESKPKSINVRIKNNKVVIIKKRILQNDFYKSF